MEQNLLPLPQYNYSIFNMTIGVISPDANEPVRHGDGSCFEIQNYL
jgi:hypothetical protein